MTTYAIHNESTADELTMSALLEMANDGQLAYDRDYAPACGVLPVDIVVCELEQDIPPNARVIHIVDVLDDAQALAYHTTDDAGRPVLRLGAKICREEAEAEGKPFLDVISDSLLHEIFETERNPYVRKYLVGPWRHKKVADEACDPLQGSGYRVGKTWIPNFTLPEWASDQRGPYDFLNVLTEPFSRLETGYLAFDDGSQDLGERMSARTRKRAGARLSVRR